MDQVLEEATTGVTHLREQLRLLHPLHQLKDYARRAAELQETVIQSMRHAMTREAQRLHAVLGRLHALSPLAVLARGYSITFKLPGRHVVMDAASMRPGQTIESRLAKGTVTSTVQAVTPEDREASG